MWTLGVSFFGLFAFVLTEITAPGIDRTVTEGVRSKGFRLVYGDEDMTIINEVATDMEKSQMQKKKKAELGEAVPPLPAEDVKCIMSVDRYCSKEMGKIKGILIQALKNDCMYCSEEQKQKAGKVAASMMAHDAHAWKTFLTRYGVEQRIQRIIG